MSEDITKDLTTGEKIDLILFKVASIETRLTALESAAEDRTRETRPKLDIIIKEISDLNERMAGVETTLRSIDRKFDVLNREIFAMKTDIREHDERLTELERKPN